MKRQTKLVIMVSPNKNIKVKIDKNSIVNVCCMETDEIVHFKLQSRYDWVGKVYQYELCKYVWFENIDKLNKHKPVDIQRKKIKHNFREFWNSDWSPTPG